MILKKKLIVKKGDSFVFTDTGEIIQPLYENYTCADDYRIDGVKFITPMTAKEEDREAVLDIILESTPSTRWVAEEKFDGTRALLHITEEGARVFSRRISVQTDWFCENSDSLPQLRRIQSDQGYTVLDGELFIPNQPFKAVASTMNCKWDKAIQRQLELGFVVLHAFDIIMYRGEDISALPLWERKQCLEAFYRSLSPIDREYVRLVPYHRGNDDLFHISNTFAETVDKRVFPDLYDAIRTQGTGWIPLTKRAYYDYVVKNGGEGLILKSLDAPYQQKRTRDFTKMKKFLTRDVIIIGFEPPTFEYKGRFPKDRWPYWFDTSKSKRIPLKEVEDLSAEYLMLKHGFTPVTKFWYEKQIGTIRFGVIVPKGFENSHSDRKFAYSDVEIHGKTYSVLEVGETSGITEEERKEFTDNQERYLYSVMEVKANEIFTDTGKLRHPRFLRMREDKDPISCTWDSHVNE